MYIIRYVHYSASVHGAAKLRLSTSLSFPKKKFIYLFPVIFLLCTGAGAVVLQYSKEKRSTLGVSRQNEVLKNDVLQSAMCVSLLSCQDTWKLNGSKLLTSGRKLRLFPISRTHRLVHFLIFTPPSLLTRSPDQFR